MSKGRSNILLLLLIVFLISNNLLWFSLGARPVHWDSSIHLTESLNASRIGSNSGTSLFKQALDVSWWYPPFVSYASIPFYRMFGESTFAAFQVMTMFLVLLVLCVYGIGSSLSGSHEVGLVAAALISTCSFAITYSRDFMLDLPLPAMVALSIFILVKTENLQRPFVSLLLGISMGLGALTKWTYPVFVAVPILYAVIKTWKSSSRWKSVRNLLVAVFIGIVIAAPWYLAHALQMIGSRPVTVGAGERTWFSSLAYYLTVVPELTSWLHVVLLFIGLILYLIFAKPREPLLYAWFLGSYILLSLISHKYSRFSFSLVVPLVLMASTGLVGWVQRSSRSAGRRTQVLTAVAVLVFVQYVIISYVPAQTTVGRWLAKPIVSIPALTVDGPGNADWGQQSILETIDRERSQQGEQIVNLRVIPDYVYFNNATFEYYTKLKHSRVKISGTSGFPLFTDYVAVKTNDIGMDSPERAREMLTRNILSDSARSTALFQPVNSFVLPDSSEAMLFRVVPCTIDSISPEKLVDELKILLDQFVRRYFKPITGYSISVVESEHTQTLRGHVSSIEVRIEKAEFGDFAFNPLGLPVEDVDVRIDDVVFDPCALLAKNELNILSIGKLRIRGLAIAAKDLKNYAEQSSNGDITLDAVEIHDGVVRMLGQSKNLGMRFDVALHLALVGKQNIAFRIEHASIGIMPLPTSVLNFMTDSFNPLITGLGFLSEVRIGALKLEHNHLTIREDSTSSSYGEPSP